MQVRSYRMKTSGVFFAGLLLGLSYLATVVPAQAEPTAETEVFGSRKDWTLWSAVVIGKVFCDQCMQNKVFPFGYPMKGAKVSVQCKDRYGKVVNSAQASTDFLGDFSVSFKGQQDLSGCAVYLAGSADSKCNIVGGGGKTVSLKSKLFFKSLYVVDPLFYKPAQPMGFCPKRTPSPGPSRGGIIVPFPNRHPSTCSYLDWLRVDYYCYWPKDLSPFKTPVGSVFGRGAQKKYGNKSLVGGMLSGDELLRQAIASLLNSRTNMHFYISPRGVKRNFSKALYASQGAQTSQAQAFKAANSGYGRGKCLLVPCKL